MLSNKKLIKLVSHLLNVQIITYFICNTKHKLPFCTKKISPLSISIKFSYIQLTKQSAISMIANFIFISFTKSEIVVVKKYKIVYTGM